MKDYKLADSAVAQSGVTIDAAMGANWYQTRGSSVGFVLKGPWTWAGTATCHEHIGNAAINHSFGDGYCGVRLVVMP